MCHLHSLRCHLVRPCRDPSGALYPTGSLLNQFVLDVLVNGNSIAYTKPLQAVLVQEVAYMGELVAMHCSSSSCSSRSSDGAAGSATPRTCLLS